MQEISLGNVDVRFGSKADIEGRQSDVCFTPKSGHCSPGCPLTARSGLMHRSNSGCLRPAALDLAIVDEREGQYGRGDAEPP